MNYSDFCQKFYIARSRIGIRGCTSQSSIALFFLEAVLGKNSSYLGFEPDLFTKWFKGTRPVTRGIWSAVTDKFNDVEYSRILVQKLNEKYTDELLTRFGVHLHDGEPFDKEMFSIALAKQFLAIAKGDGEAEDIVESAYREDFNIDAFPTYAENSLKKYEKMKTLLYTSEERPFDDFFVCNTVTMDRYHFMRNRKETSKVIENVTLDKLLSKSRFSLIVGMGGIGKSMMMRHLFLESIRIYPQTGLLPILVTLREFGTENSDLFGLIMKSVNRFDPTFTSGHLHKLLIFHPLINSTF